MTSTPKKLSLTLDDKKVEALEGETIWDVASREGTRIPHLCHLDKPGYTPDGNCRACMVEVEGERVLAASCQRRVTDGMVVNTDTERSKKSRKMVFELLASDMGSSASTPDSSSSFWEWASTFGIEDTRFASKFENGHSDEHIAIHDTSNPAIAVNLDACISCNLCVRACRDVQVNDVLGMGGRGHNTFPVFDIADPMGH